MIVAALSCGVLLSGDVYVRLLCSLPWLGLSIIGLLILTQVRGCVIFFQSFQTSKIYPANFVREICFSCSLFFYMCVNKTELGSVWYVCVCVFNMLIYVYASGCAVCTCF